MKILLFSDSENWDISKLLAAILHLGNVEFMGNSASTPAAPLGRRAGGGEQQEKVSGASAKRAHRSHGPNWS
jgi:hypothetical protein